MYSSLVKMFGPEVPSRSQLRGHLMHLFLGIFLAAIAMSFIAVTVLIALD